MRDGQRISVIIPALNEARSIANVLGDIPDWVDEVIVADNGSTDDTVSIAASHGARVVHAKRRGYGSACLEGIAALDNPDIVVFLDGDYSDHPEQMPELIAPILSGDYDLVIGSRALGNAEPGALTPQARYGNKLACFLMRVFWGKRFTDLGPFRAIRFQSLNQLQMADPDYGWTVEMQIKSILHSLRSTEVPAHYRQRIGRSKVSGTVRGVIGAGYKILTTIFISAARYHLARKKMATPRIRLIIVTRYPTPGETKTRLIPALGPEGAADLQRAMTEHALSIADAAPNFESQVWFTGADKETMTAWLGERDFAEQPQGDLGHRMRTAMEHAFRDGFDRALIIGIDCPAITTPLLQRAATILNDTRVVLGPATDGGYYLIGAQASGFNTIADTLFSNIEWGTESVYAETTSRLNEQGVPWHRLCHLNDIDEAEDLPEWDLIQPGVTRPCISIIIPALNEADSIADTLAAIPGDPSIEIILADGGSTDNTVEIAAQSGVRIVATPPGRALQMNHAAASAHGDILLFLHADTTLPPTFVDDVKALLGASKASAGAFRFATTNPTVPMRIMAATANIRARCFKLPYGDQALFMPRDLFRELDGYADLPIMEDFDLVRKIARHGTIRIAPSYAVTCARRWQRKGLLRSIILNQSIVFGWYLGVAPETLARWYRVTPRP